MALSGLETLTRSKIEKQRDKEKINMIAYADDFIVTAANKELLADKVIPQLSEALAKVRLELSNTKAKITHINDGFDFLGVNIPNVDDVTSPPYSLSQWYVGGDDLEKVTLFCFR